MTEKPILFSGPMVRAILAGRKTQTRRVVRGSPFDMVRFRGRDNRPTGEYGWCSHERVISKHMRPPVEVGTRLWVRETYGTRSDLSHVEYRADRQEPIGLPFEHIYDEQTKWRPSIFMPRKLSRIDLIVTDVQCQRLQEITEQDAMAEGFYQAVAEAPDGIGQDVVGWYARLWDSINAKRGFPWASNPWVWAYTFKRIL